MRPGESQSSERIPPKQKSPTILFEVFIGSFLSLEFYDCRNPGYTMRTVEGAGKVTPSDQDASKSRFVNTRN